MLCRICMVQLQPRKHTLDHADYAAPTRQRELWITQISPANLSALKDLDHEVVTDRTDHADYTDHTDHTNHTDHLSEV